MKKSILGIAVLGILLMFSTAAWAGHHHSYDYTPFSGHTFRVDNITVNVDDGDIVIYNEVTDDEVIVTEDYELLVNEKPIELTAAQQELVKQFHDQTYGIIDEAIKIGIEGGKIGLAGAGVGLKAVAGVFKLLLPDYDEDDLDRDMERETAKLEKKAEALEKRADALEEKANDAEDTFNEMIDVIPALTALDWE